MNGPGPGEGRFYGHYTVWSEGAGSRAIAPAKRLSYQMGTVWEFELSRDGKRVLVHGDERDNDPCTVFALNGNGQYSALRLGHTAILYQQGQRTPFSAPLIHLSPDGTVIVTGDGKRYSITHALSPLPGDMDSLLGSLGDAPDVAVSNGAASAVGIRQDGPSYMTGDFNRYNQLVHSGQMTFHLMRWDTRHGTEDLGHLGHGPHYGGVLLSADGSVAAGRCGIDGGENSVRPFVWTQGGGIRSLSAALRTAGLGPSARGWHLQEIAWVSADGAVLAGRGIDPGGKSASWVAVMPAGWQMKR